jgi:hypothetical protein
MSVTSHARAVVAGAALALACSVVSFVPASADEGSYTPSSNDVNWMSQQCGGDPAIPNDVNVVMRDASVKASPETNRLAGYVFIAEVDTDRYPSGRGLCIAAAVVSFKDTPSTRYTYSGQLTLTGAATGDPSRSVTVTKPVTQIDDGVVYAASRGIFAAPNEAITARLSVSGTETATTAVVTKTVSKHKKAKQKRSAKKKYEKSVAAAKKAYKKAHHGSKASRAKAKKTYKARLKRAKARYSKAIRPTRKTVVVTPARTTSKPFTIVGSAEVPGTP